MLFFYEDKHLRVLFLIRHGRIRLDTISIVARFLPLSGGSGGTHADVEGDNANEKDYQGE